MCISKRFIIDKLFTSNNSLTQNALQWAFFPPRFPNFSPSHLFVLTQV